MRRKRNGALAITIILTAAIFGLGVYDGHSQEIGDSVILVHMEYQNAQWSLGPDGVIILPCAAPEKLHPGGPDAPLVQVWGKDGKVLFVHQMRDPRRVLFEVPSKIKSRLAPAISFKYKFPLYDGMERFEFWSRPNKQQAPDIVVDLRPAIKEYMAKGGPKQTASCQTPAKWLAPYSGN